MEQTRTELLKGLYLVKHYLEQISENQTAQPDLTLQLQKEKGYIQPIDHVAYDQPIDVKIPHIGVRHLPETFSMTVAIAVAIMYSFQALIQGSLVELTMVVAAICIFWQSAWRWNVLRVLAVLFLVYAGVHSFQGVLKMFRYGNPALLILYLIFAVLSIFISSRIVKRKNRKIDADNAYFAQHQREIEEQNRKIDEQNQKIAAQNQAIAQQNREIARKNQQMQQRYQNQLQNWYSQQEQRTNALYEELVGLTRSWYPKDYYSLYAVNTFISLVENFRADTMKEAVNLFETEQYRNQMLEKQRALQDLLQESNELVSNGFRAVNQNLQNMQQAMEYGFQRVEENQRIIQQEIFFATVSQMMMMSRINQSIQNIPTVHYVYT